MSKYIRIGNDISLTWTINRDGDPEVFTGKRVKVKLIDKNNCPAKFDYTIQENNIVGTFYGKDQKETGAYRLLLVENCGDTEMVTLDYIDCFILSAKMKNTTSIGEDPSTNIRTEVVNVGSDITTGGHAFYTKAEIDAMFEEEDEKIEEVRNEIPSLEGYATEQWVEDKGYLTEHQDISGKADKTYVDQEIERIEGEIPSLDGYATEQWVEDKGYLTEHQSLDGYATENWVESQGYIKEHMDNVYASIRKVEDFGYEIDYLGLDYDYAKEYFNHYFPVNAGGCSVISSGDFVGRNYDWWYDNQAGFVVHTSDVVGMAGVRTLTKDIVESGRYSDDYKILPFMMQDGFNRAGLFAEMNVVPARGESKTVPTVEKRDSVCSVMLVRYILDNYTSVSQAIDQLRKYVEIYNPTSLTEMGYELHYMLKDNTNTVVIEFIDGNIVTNNINISTNFHISGVEFNADGSVYTPDTARSGQYATSQGIEEYGTGLERWNILNSSNVTDRNGMRSLMNTVLYSKAYTNTSNIWCSEFVGYSEETGVDITVDTPSDDLDFISRIDKYQNLWEHRDRNRQEVWHTTHSCVYDLNNKTLDVMFQESGVEHSFGLVYGDINGKADKTYVDQEIARVEGEIPSLEGYATEQWVENKNYLTEHQDITGKADITYVDDEIERVEGEIPSLEGYATQSWVTSQGYLTEHQSLAGYATESWVESQGYLTEHQDITGKADKSYVDDEIADVRSEIPSLTGYATESWVNNQGFLKEHQSLSGYATEQWVENKNYLTEHQSIKTINGESIVGTGNINIEGGNTDEIEDVIATAYNLLNDKIDDVESEIPDVSGFVNLTQVQALISQESLRIDNELQKDEDVIANALQYFLKSNDVNDIIKMTQAEYDLIVTPDPNTLYIITD